MYTSTPFGKKIGMLRRQTSSTKYSPTWEKNSAKEEEVKNGRLRVICRFRVGHTWLTQSYLLKNEEQPFCYACDSLYTVRHILIECSDFQVTKGK
ncbi:ribonuclease hi [Plakobranchus ocellatus]|uniref:Ribonuclease hi n=1 Tax=Plakobranchus ocellatus TaxID=259542 RepID=A0AAV3XWX5_9GAST|nr:ribonuclease hi [Plakobranchus ocellatus]